MKNLYELDMTNKKRVSAEEFLKLCDTEEIENSQFIAPKVGEKGFGYFLVSTKDWRINTDEQSAW